MVKQPEATTRDQPTHPEWITVARDETLLRGNSAIQQGPHKLRIESSCKGGPQIRRNESTRGPPRRRGDLPPVPAARSAPDWRPRAVDARGVLRPSLRARSGAGLCLHRRRLPPGAGHQHRHAPGHGRQARRGRAPRPAAATRGVGGRTRGAKVRGGGARGQRHRAVRQAVRGDQGGRAGARRLPDLCQRAGRRFDTPRHPEVSAVEGDAAVARGDEAAVQGLG